MRKITLGLLSLAGTLIVGSVGVGFAVEFVFGDESTDEHDLDDINLDVLPEFVRYSVTFVANNGIFAGSGDTSVRSIDIGHGKLIAAPDVARDGFDIRGWTTTINNVSTLFDFELTPIIFSTVLYALWEEIPFISDSEFDLVNEIPMFINKAVPHMGEYVARIFSLNSDNRWVHYNNEVVELVDIEIGNNTVFLRTIAAPGQNPSEWGAFGSSYFVHNESNNDLAITGILTEGFPGWLGDTRDVPLLFNLDSRRIDESQPKEYMAIVEVDIDAFDAGIKLLDFLDTSSPAGLAGAKTLSPRDNCPYIWTDGNGNTRFAGSGEYALYVHPASYGAFSLWASPLWDMSESQAEIVFVAQGNMANANITALHVWNTGGGWQTGNWGNNPFLQATKTETNKYHFTIDVHFRFNGLIAYSMDTPTQVFGSNDQTSDILGSFDLQPGDVMIVTVDNPIPSGNVFASSYTIVRA